MLQRWLHRVSLCSQRQEGQLMNHGSALIQLTQAHLIDVEVH